MENTANGFSRLMKAERRIVESTCGQCGTVILGPAGSAHLDSERDHISKCPSPEGTRAGVQPL